jgi:hypothetical protein
MGQQYSYRGKLSLSRRARLAAWFSKEFLADASKFA